MTRLAVYTCALGGLTAALCLAALLAPTWFRRQWQGFPRNPIWGCLLAAVDLAWAAYVVHGAELGMFGFLRPYIYPLAIMAYAMIIVLMNELLAPRALGGLLLLVSNPMLNAARWLDSPWRFVMVILAYVLVIKGMVLVLSPYWFRKAGERLYRSEAGCRAWGLTGFVFGLFLVALGLAVYH